MKRVEDISLNHTLNNLLNSRVTGMVQSGDDAFAQIKSFQSSFKQISRTPDMIRLMLQTEFNFVGFLEASQLSQKEKLQYLASSWFDSTFVVVDYAEVERWLQKCLHEAESGRTVVALVPARTHTMWFHEIVLEQAKELRFVKGRVTMDGKQNVTPDALVIFHGVPNKRPRNHTSNAVLQLKTDLKGNSEYDVVLK